MDVIMESYFDGNNPWGWKDTSLDLYKWSGYRLVDEINSQKPRSVLDVGCGFNRFKGKINNLMGIDPYNDLCRYQSITRRLQSRTCRHSIMSWIY